MANTPGFPNENGPSMGDAGAVIFIGCYGAFASGRA